MDVDMDEDVKMLDSENRSERTNQTDPRLKHLINAAKLWNRMPLKGKEAYRSGHNDTRNRQKQSCMEFCDEADCPMTSSDDMRCPRRSRGQRAKPQAHKTTTKCAQPAVRKRKKPNKWVKPGPITNNAYLNFVRTVRRKYCGLLAKQLVMLAAQQWRCLSESKKQRYRRQARQLYLPIILIYIYI